MNRLLAFAVMILLHLVLWFVLEPRVEENDPRVFWSERPVRIEVIRGGQMVPLAETPEPRSWAL